MKNPYLLVTISLIALLAACSDPRPPEKIVAERAQARWDFLVARDFQEAWAYHTPGFRARNPHQIYGREMADRPIRWDSAEVVDTDCGEEECIVRVEVRYTAVGAPGNLADLQSDRRISEQWLRMGGEWWISLEQ